VAEGEGGERGVSAGAAARDDAARRVGETAAGQESRAVDGVVHIHDAPVPIEQLAVRAPVAGAAAVIHVEDGNPAARPILDPQVQRAGGGGGRSAMALD